MKQSHQESQQPCSQLPSQINKSHNKLLNIESIIELFNKTEKYFSYDIQKQIMKENQSKDKLTNDKCQSSLGNQILTQFQTFLNVQTKVHIDQAQRQVVFQEALNMVVLFLQKFQTKTGYKKSNRIRKFLTKFLFKITTFAIQKIYKSAKKPNFSHYLQKSVRILLLGNDSQKQQKKQISIKNANPTKSLTFQVPLTLSPKKIPFPFYFILQLLQNEIPSQNLQKNIKNLVDEIGQITKELLKQQNRQIGYLWIKLTCQIIGFFQLPVALLLFQEIIKLLEIQFMDKYLAINNRELQLFRFNREIFSLKTIQLLTQTLINHSSNLYSQIEYNIKSISQQELNPTACIYCQSTTHKFIFINLRKPTHPTKYLTIQICQQCIYQLSNLSIQSIIKSNYNIGRQLILNQVINVYWRQQYQLEKVSQVRKVHLKMSSFYDGRDDVYQLVDSFQSNRSKHDTTTCLNLINSLYWAQLIPYQQQIKGKTPFNKHFLLSKHLNKLLSISASIRQQAIKVLSSQILIAFINQKISLIQIQTIFSDKPQSQTIQTVSQTHKRLYKILQQTKNHLKQKSLQVKIKVLKFLFILVKVYKSEKLRLFIVDEISKGFCYRLGYLRIVRNKDLSMESGQKGQYFDVLKVVFEHVYYAQSKGSLNHTTINYNDSNDNKQLLIKLLCLFFQCLSFQTIQHITIFQKDNLGQIVQYSQQILIRLQKITKQSYQLENYASSKRSQINQNNRKKPQYQLLVINFLKKYYFSKQTIRCFKINDLILQMLVDHAENNQKQQKEIDISALDNNNSLMINFNLILQELLSFSRIVQKSQFLSESVKKSKKKTNPKVKKIQKKQIINSKIRRSQSFRDQTSPRTCLNLQKTLTLLLKTSPPSSITSSILHLLLQNHILSIYQQTFPSKINSQVLNQLHSIFLSLIQLIKSCSFDQLNVNVKLFVSIAVLEKDQQKVATVFTQYKKAYQYFFTRYRVNHLQKDQRFLVRVIKTITHLAIQLQKYHQIKSITQSTQHINPQQYNKFTSLTPQLINSFQSQPHHIFLYVYQCCYDFFMYVKNKIQNKQFSAYHLLSNYLDSLADILGVYPQFIIGVNAFLIHFSQNLKPNKQYLKSYLKVCNSIVDSKDSYLTKFLQKSLVRLKPHYLQLDYDIVKVAQPAIRRKQVQNILQQFYSILIQLLYEQTLNLHQCSIEVLYGFFLPNQLIKTKLYNLLQYFNKKGNDYILFNNFQKTFDDCLGLFIKYLANQQIFNHQHKDGLLRNVKLLNMINKENCQINKPLLIKDIKFFNIRATFVKKIAQFIQAKTFSLKIFSPQQSHKLILLFQILLTFNQMDIYEYNELLFCLQKFIKENYINLISLQKPLQSHINQTLQKLYQILVLAQCLFLLISLLNERKLKKVKKQIIILIQKRKFTSKSINLPVNTIKQLDETKQIRNYQSLDKYQSMIRELGKNQDQIGLDLLCNQIRDDAMRMYQIVFQDKQARAHHVEEKKQKQNNKKTKRSIYQGQSDTDSDYDNSNSNSLTKFSDIQNPKSISNSVRSSQSSLQNNKKTKKVFQNQNKLKVPPRNDQRATKKNMPRKIRSNSEKKLSSITQNIEQNKFQEEYFNSRRKSKRLQNKKIKLSEIDG